MKMDKKDRQMGRRMLTVYQDTDREIKQKAEGASCKKGCSSCCTLLIAITFPEAVALADYLLRQPDWSLKQHKILKILHEQVGIIAEGMANKDLGHYFRAKQDCAFLDPEEKTCTVYAARPSSCRLHYVTGDPDNCKSGSTVPRQNVDLQKVSLFHLHEALRVSKQTNTPLFNGPFQIMLLWAMKLLTEGREALEAAHADPDFGLSLLSLHHWRMKTSGTEPTEPNAAPEAK